MVKVEMQKQIARALAHGYLQAVLDTHGDSAGADTWIVHGDMDINLCGSDYTESAPQGGLAVIAYPAGWEGNLPEPLFTLTVKYGKSK